MKMTWCSLKIKENCHELVNQSHRNFHSKTPSCRDVKWWFNASWGLKGLRLSLSSTLLFPIWGFGRYIVYVTYISGFLMPTTCSVLALPATCPLRPASSCLSFCSRKTSNYLGLSTLSVPRPHQLSQCDFVNAALQRQKAISAYL